MSIHRQDEYYGQAMKKKLREKIHKITRTKK